MFVLMVSLFVGILFRLNFYSCFVLWEKEIKTLVWLNLQRSIVSLPLIKLYICLRERFDDTLLFGIDQDADSPNNIGIFRKIIKVYF